ncbi:CDC42 small effector protein 1 isoform X10 [Hyla sarda]|uniref:CDC42 small effector protein 1 isoform X10 n=1 Tax=Hyla sarda TaxID=327740 RepID=UPI0024C2B35B|nr:CDC42 small effector protein 1 isoform X10 [Hyla sarda]
MACPQGNYSRWTMVTTSIHLHSEDSSRRFQNTIGTTPRWGDQLHCNFPPGAEKTRRTTGGPRALPGSPKPVHAG